MHALLYYDVEQMYAFRYSESRGMMMIEKRERDERVRKQVFVLPSVSVLVIRESKEGKEKGGGDAPHGLRIEI